MQERGLRERKKAATSHLLETTALRLVLERGLHAVTVEEISDAADVSPRTFFNYFACKEDAILGPPPDPAELLGDVFAAQPADQPVMEALRAAIVASSNRYLGSRSDLQARMRVAAENPGLATRLLSRFAELERCLATAVAARLGAEPDDVRCTVAAAIAVGILRSAARRWASSANEHDQSFAEAVDEAFGVALRLTGGGEDSP